MAYEVTSWFIDQVEKASLAPVRKFTIGRDINNVNSYAGAVVWGRSDRVYIDSVADGASDVFSGNAVSLISSAGAVESGYVTNFDVTTVTNILRGSRQFDNTSYWVQIGTINTSVGLPGIDGVNSAVYFRDDDAGAASYITNSNYILPDSAVQHTAGFYVAKQVNSGSYPVLRARITEPGVGSIADGYLWIDTDVGSVALFNTVGSIDARISEIQSFWKCEVIMSNSLTGTGSCVINYDLYPARGTTWGTFAAAAVGGRIFDIAGLVVDDKSELGEPIVTNSLSVTQGFNTLVMSDYLATIPDSTYTWSVNTGTVTEVSSDYSDRVNTWPRINRQWDKINPVRMNIVFANEDKSFNFMRDDKSTLTSTVVAQFGFTHPTSGDELVNIFVGQVQEAKYKDATVSLAVRDKMKPFLETQLGTDENPVSFSNTEYLPSDVAWTLVTCYGGYSTIQDSSNPDIDFQSFEDWASIFSSDNLWVRADYRGKKLGQAISAISRYTHSGIFVENNKMVFKRFTDASSHEVNIDHDTVRGIKLELSDATIINKQWVYADYNVTSKSWGIQVFDSNTPSVETFGAREQIIKEDSIWYVSSAAAKNLAERMIGARPEPSEEFVVSTTLKSFPMQIGDTVTLTDSFFGIDSSQKWRIMDYGFNMNDGGMELVLDRSQIGVAFILDDAIYGVLDTGPGRLL